MKYFNSRKIALTYVLFGIIWIVGSDYVIEIFELNNIYWIKSQTVKGITFVIASAVLIYFLANRGFNKIINYKNALELNEKGLQTTLDSIGDAVIATDTNGSIVRINPVAQDLTGWSLEEALGSDLNKVFRIVHAKSRNPSVNPLNAVLRTGRIQGLANHTLLISRNGEEYQISDSASPIRDDNGKITGVVLVFRDVTEKYRQDEKIKESERKFKTLMSNLPGMAYRCHNTPKWPMEFISEGCFELTGYSYSEMMSRASVEYGDLIHPEDEGYVQESVKDAIARDSSFEMEYRIHTKNGEEKWVMERGQSVGIDANGTEILEGFITDITDLKLTEKSLENERAFLSALIDSLEEAIVICDQNGRIIRFNESARRLHGLLEEQVTPELWSDYYDLYRVDGITPLPREEIPLFRALQGERFSGQEIVVAPEHSTPATMVCSGQGMFDENGNKIGAVVAMFDITERKRLELRLEFLATTDELTDLWNHRYIIQTVKQELEQSFRYGDYFFSLLMMDIDYFKQINDLHGHDAGDKVLSYIGDAIKNMLRQVDIAGRYGGEEFVVILPQTNKENAYITAERIRQYFYYNPLNYNNRDIYFTVSIGIAEYRQSVNSAEEILKIADYALYEAKHKGRNLSVIGPS